ncbi:hypothetical protein RRG08_060474 [Elysia crispata]|uniref:Uncharacterized protein n=1 Tax=Elysia crispata TaxID=231223 RepID=A0AAE1E869_9GAST|nr:hypothetical protein RRG08_060474 [Elysia crispata]
MVRTLRSLASGCQVASRGPDWSDKGKTGCPHCLYHIAILSGAKDACLASVGTAHSATATVVKIMTSSSQPGDLTSTTPAQNPDPPDGQVQDV